MDAHTLDAAGWHLNMNSPQTSPPNSSLPQHKSPEWIALVLSLPEGVSAQLTKKTEAFEYQQCIDLVAAWARLQKIMRAKGQTVESCLACASKERSEKDPKKSLAWELRITYILQIQSQSQTPPSESDLNYQYELCNVLVGALGFAPSPTLTLRRYTQPRQSFPESFDQELQEALEIEGKLIQLFDKVYAGKVPPPSDPAEKMGALILALTFDAGVLSVPELRAIIAVLGEPVRAVDGCYYLWLKLAESRGAVQEYRRVLLPDLSAALAIAAQNSASDPNLTIKKCLKAIARRLGYGSKHRLSIKRIQRGVKARLRAQRGIPQYVVDYCDYTIHSNSLNESAWRRIQDYVPWPDDQIPEDSTTRAREPDSKTQVPEEPIDERGDDVLSQVSRIFNTSADTAESLTKILAIRSRFDAATATRPVIHHVLDWVVELHRAISSNGKVRRVNSIRNLVTALVPRLIAGVGSHRLEDLDEDEWQCMLELVVDEEMSESWRSTIKYSFWNFLRFMETQGVLVKSPMGEWVGRMASHVNANVLSFEEFQRCIDDAGIDLASNPIPERKLMKLLLVLGFHLGIRKSEGLGIRACDIDPGPRPTLDVVHNEHRLLKTDSSERRIPLGLLDDHYYEALVDRATKAANRNGQLIDEYRRTSEIDSSIRKVIRIIQLVTDDPSTHYHTLRHSTATWILIALCAAPLQLERLTIQFPFLKDVLHRAAAIRSRLRGRQCSLHDLHAVKQLLGHRHEEMTLLHYIHCMDMLRYAAVTLNKTTPAPEILFGACGLTKWNRKLRRPEKREAHQNPLRLIESAFPANVRRHDVKLPTKELSLSVQLRNDQPLRDWRELSKKFAAEVAANPDRVPNHKDRRATKSADNTLVLTKMIDLVALINESKILGAKKKIKVLEDIKPKVRADQKLALGLSIAFSNDQGRQFDHVAFVTTLFIASIGRGFGWYQFDSEQRARSISEWLHYLGTSAGFNVVFGKEVNTTNRETKKRSRHIVEFADLTSLHDSGSSRILLKLQLMDRGARKSFPHSAFVWALAIYAQSKAVVS